VTEQAEDRSEEVASSSEQLGAQAASDLGMTQEQLGDCPDFRAAKMGLSPSQMRKLFLSHPLFGQLRAEFLKASERVRGLLQLA